MAHNKNRINEGKYMFAALLYLLRIPFTVASVGLLLYAAISQAMNALILAGVVFFFTIIIYIAFYIKSSGVSCRLCRATFLRNLKCSKKKNVRKFFGRYTLPVALSIIFRRPMIRCPYCGEKHPYFKK